MKRGDLKGEFKGLRGWVARMICKRNGRGIDDLAKSLAAELGRRDERQVEREMIRTVTRPTAVPKQRIARIKQIDAILDGRALKTGLVPVYFDSAGPPPLAPELAAEMRRRADAIRQRERVEEPDTTAR